MIKKVLNPVGNFDEKVLLLVGLTCLGLNIFLGSVLGFKMDSIVHVSLQTGSLQESAYTTIKSIALAIVLYYFLGLIINKRTRPVDIINTVLVAAIALFISALILSFLPIQDAALKGGEMPSIPDLIKVFFILLVIAPLAILSVIILYNGFKTATNLKSGFHVALFIIVTTLLSVFSPFIF